MKFIAIVCLVALASAAPAPQDFDTSVLRDDRDIRTDGFSYNIELSDGTKLAQEGKPLPDSGALVKTGTIEWVFPDGQIFQLSYVADENGYRPTSEFLPVFGVPEQVEQ